MKHKIEVDAIGRITHSMTIFGVDHNPTLGIVVNEPVDIDTHCWDIDNQEIKLKEPPVLNIDKTSMLADGSDTINISDLPNKTIIELDGQVFEIDDGIFTFTIDTPGTHKLKVRTGIDLPEEIEINAS